MKTKNIFGKVTGLVIALTFFFGSAFAGNDPGNNKQSTDKMKQIRDSVEIALEKHYGTNFTLDSSLKEGAINYAKDQEFVKGQGHINSRLYADFDLVNSLEASFFSGSAIKTIQRPEFQNYLELYGTPKNFWVEQVKIGETYYVVITIE